MIHQLFEKQVEQAPDKTAAYFEESHLTYQELNDRAEKLAQQLRFMGVGPDVLVGFLVERSLDVVVGLLAILKAGGAYIPLDPSHPASRIVSVLEDAQPLLLLTSDRLEGSLPPHRTRSVTISGALAAEAVDSGPRPAPSLNNLAYVIYTSGSTGKPKGVEIEHAAVLNFLASMRRRPGLKAEDTVLAITTLAFDIAVLEIILPLVCGASVVIANTETARDGTALSALMQRHGVTVIQATPSTFRLLLDAGWMGSPHLKILCGGEAWSTELAQSLLPRCGSLWNMYGPTETTIWSAVAKVEEEQPVAIGAPIANTKLYVLDRALQLVPVGVPGELCIGGIGLARGYLNRPELTRERFVPDPYSAQPSARIYRTGDLVRRLANGTLEFLGRLDHQVKIRGHRIELGEIEAAIRGREDIAQAVVIAREDEPEQRQLVAYVVSSFTNEGFEARASTEKVLESRLREELQARLPDYMAPSAFVFLDQLPLTPNGKLDRKALPIPAKSFISGTLPQTLIEKEIERLWCELLVLKEAGINDNFFELGGNSLLAARVVGAINRQFGLKLSVSTIFLNPTIRSIGKVVEQSHSIEHDQPKVVSIRAGQKGFPIYLVGTNPSDFRIAQFIDKRHSIFAIDAPIAAKVAIDEDDQKQLTVRDLGRIYGDTLLAHAGTSPFVIAGYSFWGKVAFEAAHRAKDRGGKVAIIILIDAYAWTAGFGFSFGAFREGLKWLWRRSDATVNKTNKSTDPFERMLNSLQLLRWLVGRIPEMRRLRSIWNPFDGALNSKGQALETQSGNVLYRTLAKTFCPRQLDAAGALIRSTFTREELLPEIEFTNGWNGLFMRGLDVSRLPGDHISILSDVKIAKLLAQQIDTLVERSGSDVQYFRSDEASLGTKSSGNAEHGQRGLFPPAA